MIDRAESGLCRWSILIGISSLTLDGSLAAAGAIMTGVGLYFDVAKLPAMRLFPSALPSLQAQR